MNRLALAGVAALAVGCASAPWQRERVAITRAELLAAGPLGLPPASPEPADEAQVLALNAEMREFLDEHVARTAGRLPRLRQLAYSIINGDSFRLEYDEQTRTADETFRTRRGNCLSFSNLFVALAREVGLDASFQEVDVPPDWSLRDDTFVLNRHVNVLVDLRREGEHVVDFDMEDFRSSYDRRVISDARALAHFYNNEAVEQMQAGDTSSALASFRAALRHDQQFSPAWTNLGILYWRAGRSDYAEAAYLQALQADRTELVAMSNLASLYERRGDGERAAAYRRRVTAHRERNPYYRYQQARQAFLSRDYDTAIRHLEYAIRRKRNEDQFYLLLGASWLGKGDARASERWLRRAQEVAASDVLKRRYESKIENLLSVAPARE